jgi:hypothetical protein
MEASLMLGNPISSCPEFEILPRPLARLSADAR